MSSLSAFEHEDRIVMPLVTPLCGSPKLCESVWFRFSGQIFCHSTQSTGGTNNINNGRILFRSQFQGSDCCNADSLAVASWDSSMAQTSLT